jgi:hypothetical protein
MIHGGRDYATPEKRIRSMELFMTEVAPKLRRVAADSAKAEAAE